MIEGRQHHKSDQECPYSWLNEWLCEYVDGTMDPSLRNNFEEYLAANPELAEHVKCLQRTRDLLCKQGADNGVPRTLKERLADHSDGQNDDAGDAQQPQEISLWESSRWPIYRTIGGMVGMFVVGMAVGAFFWGGTLINPSGEVLSDGPDHDVQIETATTPAQSPHAVGAFSGSSDRWDLEPTSATPILSPDLHLPPTIMDTSVAPATHLSDRR